MPNLSQDYIETLICDLLEIVYKDYITGNTTAQSPGNPRITLVVHGIRNKEQADEVWRTMDQLPEAASRLKKHYTSIRIVAISSPQLLRHVSKDDSRAIMEYVHTLHFSETGFIRYSGRSPTPPAFYEVGANVELVRISFHILL
jgi:hypothetical protein